MSKSKYKISTDVYTTTMAEKDFGGIRGKKAVDLSKAGLTKDDYFMPETGDRHKLNIIPFLIESDKNPQVARGKFKVGQAAYLLDLYEHKNIGPNKDAVVCPKENYGKPCPICEERSRLLDQAENASGEKVKEFEKAAGALKAKRRAYLNVQRIVDGKAQPIQAFNTSHYRFMKELLEEANECADGNGPLPFACPEDGSEISFRCTSGMSDYDIVYKNIKFSDRKEEIEEEVLESSISFDKYINILTAEEIEAILWGQDVEEVAEDPKPEPAAEPEKEEVAEEKEESPAEEEDENPCPNGKIFGDDYDSDPEVCDSCSDCTMDIWKACMSASRQR